ncbi:hypothetical protein I4F81_004592 [Pyropia yezoensis]|uniref:Uncharacterized protein n=1 Tax=Pyropia yezoensis TaxID=2788 RepID=A0ACC3BWE3_PYRYE|nr:hypothetical protein I4F81_004592 [Neopyropia yezoensis]
MASTYRRLNDFHSGHRPLRTSTERRKLDLSPARLEAVAAANPALVAELAGRLESSLAFFTTARTTDVPRLQAALAEAAGVSALATDRLCNYRLVDYYERVVEEGDGDAAGASGGGADGKAVGPRCGEHRDFGAMTLVFPGGPGLEVCAAGDTWTPVTTRPGEAVLLFGWCAAFRSNKRIPAAPVYKCVTAGALRAEIGRKWRHREATLSDMEQAPEVEHSKRFATQDAFIAAQYSA